MHNYKLTKIVATIGPASETAEKIESLILSGVNVFRFNTKHSTPAWHDEHIRLVQKIADKLKVKIGILLDLQGPEIRLETRDKAEIEVASGSVLKIGLSFVEGVDVVIPHAAIFKLLKKGDDLLVDDGFVETQVIKVDASALYVEIKNDSVIKHRKGVNLPGKEIDFPGLIKRDLEQLEQNSRNKIDYVGLSFVRSAHDIQVLRAEMVKRNLDSMIVSKIESQPALDRLDEIIHESDAVMIARGDLGVEVPYEQLAFWQRTIMDKCRLAHKPVITATQMLESMINNPRPTRAEVTDVAHAVIEGTDAVMLSGESASGKYPVRTVQTMAKIVKWNEEKSPTHKVVFNETDPTNTIANAVASIVSSRVTPPITGILVFTETGYTARALSKHRLKVPIIAATGSLKTAESLTISYGISPVVVKLPSGPFSSITHILDDLVLNDSLHRGDTIVVVHGHHWRTPGNTNSLSIITL